MTPLEWGSGFSISRSCLWWWNRLLTKGWLNLSRATLYTTLADKRSPSFSLPTEVPWLTIVRLLGQRLGFAWPIFPRLETWPYLAFIGNVVSAGWRTGREVEEEDWLQISLLPSHHEPLEVGRVCSTQHPTEVQSIPISLSHLPLLPNMHYPKTTPRVHTQYS